MKQSEVDKIITKIEKNVAEAHELLKEAVELSSNIDFEKLKDVVNIEKYEDLVHYISQNLSFMSVGAFNYLEWLYNKKYWEVCRQIRLENNNLECILDDEPDKFISNSDRYMWEDLEEEFRKMPYSSNEDQDIINKVHEFYEAKTKEELTLKSEGFCKDYVKKKGDTGILNGKWWIEEGIAKIIENYWKLEIEKGDRKSLEEE